MSLPEKWPTIKLKDISEKITKGSTPTSYGYSYKTEGIRFIKTENIDENSNVFSTTNFIDEETNEFLKRSILHENDLLFSIAGTIGRIALIKKVDLPGNTNQALAIIRILPEVISHKYLLYYLKSEAIQKKALKKIVGVGRANLSLKNLGEFEIKIAPENEQKRIVAEIEKQFSRLDEAVESLKRVKANLKRYKASVLKAAVEGKLTEEWRKKHPDVEPADKLLEHILTERRKKWEEAELAKMKAKGKEPKNDKWKKKYKEPSKPDLNKLPLLPASWEWASVEQLAEIQLGKMLDRQKHLKGNSLAYLRNINVRWGAINTDDLLEMFYKETELNKYGLEAGDVLVCEGGEPGRAAVWDSSFPDMKYQKALHRVRFYQNFEAQLLVYYLEFLSQTGRLKRWFTGSTIKHFTKESFSGLPVPLPPKDEQVEIVSVTEEHLSNILVLERNVDANLIRAERLRQSILKRAFSGELLKNRTLFTKEIYQ